jgi:hypothetical protein
MAVREHARRLFHSLNRRDGGSLSDISFDRAAISYYIQTFRREAKQSRCDRFAGNDRLRTDIDYPRE